MLILDARSWPKAVIQSGMPAYVKAQSEYLVAPDLTPRRDRPAPVQPLYEGYAWAGAAHYRLGGGDILGGEFSVRSCQL